MATKKVTKAKKSNVALEVGAGVLAAAAAAGAGYYFYGTANAKKHRQAASTWAKSMKNDVVKQAKSLKKLDAKTIGSIVDKTVATYKNAKGATPADVQAAARELKKNWNLLQKELAPSKQVKKAVTKAAKPAAKAAKKAVKTAKKVTKAVKKTAKRP
jgi:pyruvate/2-oxoglutarate/acetoin dehydrogenase E1 component